MKDVKPNDKVKYTWLRHIMVFMIKYPTFRSIWLLRLFKNSATHILYKDGKVVQKYYVRDFATVVHPLI